MNKIILILALYTISIITQAESVFFVNDYGAKNQNNAFFLNIREEGNISGRLDQEALGLCIRNCSKSFIFSDIFGKSIARMNGFTGLTEEQKNLYQLPSYPLDINTSQIEESRDYTAVSVSSKMLGMESQGRKYNLYKSNLDVEFTNKENILPQRFSYKETSPTHQKLSKSVFQISGKSEANGTGSQGDTHGTGFFISNTGHALTNLHVINIDPTCIKKRSCNLNIKQKGDKVKSYQLKTRILTCSKLNDFCLIKVVIPETLKISPLEIQTNIIPRELMTLGFPGDKLIKDPETNESREEVALTYSYGEPVGFSGRTVTSSLFISSGASGSPVIDSSTLKVVGLNSNGAETFANGFDGAPGLFRTLYLIDKEFSISRYLDGRKQKIIEKIIRKIRDSSSKEEVKQLLQEHHREKTFYGMSKLQVLSYAHPSVKVRKEIIKFFHSWSHDQW